MGLRFCNEVVIAAEQIYPTPLEVACGSASKPLVNDQVKFHLHFTSSFFEPKCYAKLLCTFGLCLYFWQKEIDEESCLSNIGLFV